MELNEHHDVLIRLGEIMSSLEDLESALITKFGDRNRSAVWVRLTSCFVVLTSLEFSDEFKERFGGTG